ncbi:bactofilin family protein [Halobacterium yunchengense]|uniref:bactofilin family protein n=1 Tax=Halobacterium yunchengense TaxID=3108497 RepID=UPI003009CF1C
MLRSGSRSAVLLAVVVLLATPVLVGTAAADERVGGTVVVEEGETVDGLQATGGSVVVRGTVDGDLQAFAGSVDVAETGTVTGSVEGAAGSVRVAGTVEGDVRVAAGTVDVAESGVVRGDLEAGAGSFALAGTVDGTARVGAGSISLADTARVGGDFVYDGDLTAADGATVDGELREDPSISVSPVPGFAQVADWVFTLYSFLLTFVVGAVLLVAFPGVSRTVADGLRESPARSLGVGLLVLFGVPVALVALFVTIVGIPLGVLGVFLYVLLVLLAFVWGEYAVGAWLLSVADREGRLLALAVGIAAVYLLGRVPVVGGLVEFLVLLVGLGGVGTAAYAWVRGRRGGDADGGRNETGGGADAA